MKNINYSRGIDVGLQRCNSCGITLLISQYRCTRCNKKTSYRLKYSFRNTSLLLVSAFILLFPANLLPMIIFQKLGNNTSNTIMSSINILFNTGMYSIAVIIFMASIVIPIFKIISLSWLLFSTNHCSTTHISKYIVLYRFISYIGRWSMLDIFVINIILSLLHFSPFISVTIGWGASAFSSVVILTIIATLTFDPRLLWDALEKNIK